MTLTGLWGDTFYFIFHLVALVGIPLGVLLLALYQRFKKH